MYGSDKVLLSLVSKLKDEYAPVVLLPRHGPLFDAMKALSLNVRVIPLVVVGRRTFGFAGLLRLPLDTWRSVRAISRVVREKQIDVVYSNTLAVLSGAVWAWLHSIRHVWHVHEIIERPVMARKGFAWLLRLLATKVICNSSATRQALLNDQPALAKKTSVVWNGLQRETPVDKEQVQVWRSQLGLEADEVLVVLVGRVNRWKGQGLLVRAADVLWCNGVRNCRFLIVGSAPEGQPYFHEKLLKDIAASNQKERIIVWPYRDDVWAVWDMCDIAVVPSTESEPFGLVAVEAMAAGKSVIAAAHGGLVEIVRHEETGLLFEPGNADALADAITRLAGDEALRKRFGENGLQRFNDHFTLDLYVAGIRKAIL